MHIKLIAAKNAIRLINHLSTGVSVLLDDVVLPHPQNANLRNSLASLVGLPLVHHFLRLTANS
jgi:hypothetical protein